VLTRSRARQDPQAEGSEQAKQKNPLQDAGSKFNKSCERTASLSPAKRQCVADIKQDSEKIAEMPPAVRQIEISAEEAAMNGAPEGTLVAVDVVLSKDFLPSKAPQEELATALNTDISDWTAHYNAVVSIRRLCLFHADLLGEQDLAPIVAMVGDACGNLRSTVVRNAMMCFQDMFAHLSASAMECSIDETIKALLQQAASELKFISNTAREVLDQAGKTGPLAAIMAVVLTEITSSTNANVVVAALRLLEACLNTVGVGRTPGAGYPLDNLSAVVLGAAKGLRSKKQDGRDLAKKALKRLRRALGDDVFRESANTALEGCTAEVEEVMKNSVMETKKKGKPTGSSSIREQMMARKKQLAAEAAASSSTGFEVCL